MYHVSWSRQVAVADGLFTTLHALLELPDTVTTVPDTPHAIVEFVSCRPGNR